MKLTHAFGLGLSTLFVLGGCSLDLVESDAGSSSNGASGRVAATAATTTDVVVTPVSVVRDVEGQKITLNYSVYDRLQGVVASFTVSNGTSKASVVYSGIKASDRSVTLNLPTVLGSKYATFGGSTLRVLPVIDQNYPYWAGVTITPAAFLLAVTQPSTLAVGQGLFPNECMRSPSRSYSLCMESDGNLVERDATGLVVWQTSRGGSGASTLLLSAAGVLSTRNAAGTATWSTGGTWTSFDLLDDGNRVVKYKTSLYTRTKYL